MDQGSKEMSRRMEGKCLLSSCERPSIAVTCFKYPSSRVISEKLKMPIDLGGKWKAVIIQLITEHWMSLCRCRTQCMLSCYSFTMSSTVVTVRLLPAKTSAGFVLPPNIFTLLH